MDILERAEKYENYMVEQRRYFHRIPEPSWEEVRTTIGIERQLEDMGISPMRFEGISGVCGEVGGRNRDNDLGVLLLRADIDGVEMREETGLPYASENRGMMHATGRDGHIAMMLGAARILKDIEEKLPGKVRILFQAAEESAQGAPEYIQRGVLKDVRGVYAAHLFGCMPASRIDVTYGYRMAGADRFDIEIYGKSAHGSMPHLGRDAIGAAAQVIQGIQSYVSRENDPLKPLVVSVGTIRGGRQRNTMADYVKMEGTVRTQDREARKKTEENLRKVITSAAQVMGCRAQLRYEYMLPPLENNPRLVSIAEKAVEKLFGDGEIVHLPGVMASEDFAFYTENIPGIYINIGCAPAGMEEKNYNYSPGFQIEEGVLKKGAALCAQLVMDYFEKEGERKWKNT